MFLVWCANIHSYRGSIIAISRWWLTGYHGSNLSITCSYTLMHWQERRFAHRAGTIDSRLCHELIKDRSSFIAVELLCQFWGSQWFKLCSSDMLIVLLLLKLLLLFWRHSVLARTCSLVNTIDTATEQKEEKNDDYNNKKHFICWRSSHDWRYCNKKNEWIYVKERRMWAALCKSRGRKVSWKVANGRKHLIKNSGQAGVTHQNKWSTMWKFSNAAPNSCTSTRVLVMVSARWKSEIIRNLFNMHDIDMYIYKL